MPYIIPDYVGPTSRPISIASDSLGKSDSRAASNQNNKRLVSSPSSTGSPSMTPPTTKSKVSDPHTFPDPSPSPMEFSFLELSPPFCTSAGQLGSTSMQHDEIRSSLAHRSLKDSPNITRFSTSSPAVPSIAPPTTPTMTTLGGFGNEFLSSPPFEQLSVYDSSVPTQPSEVASLDKSGGAGAFALESEDPPFVDALSGDPSWDNPEQLNPGSYTPSFILNLENSGGAFASSGKKIVEDTGAFVLLCSRPADLKMLSNSAETKKSELSIAMDFDKFREFARTMGIDAPSVTPEPTPSMYILSNHRSRDQIMPFAIEVDEDDSEDEVLYPPSDETSFLSTAIPSLTRRNRSISSGPPPAMRTRPVISPTLAPLSSSQDRSIGTHHTASAPAAQNPAQRQRSVSLMSRPASGTPYSQPKNF